MTYLITELFPTDSQLQEILDLNSALINLEKTNSINGDRANDMIYDSIKALNLPDLFDEDGELLEDESDDILARFWALCEERGII